MKRDYNDYYDDDYEDEEEVTEPERPRKKRRSKLGLVITTLLLMMTAAMMLLVLYFKGYAPDPDKNKYNDLHWLAPDSGEADPSVNPGNSSHGGNDSFVSQSQKVGRYNFLIVGLDKISRSTDIIMIVSYDVDAGKINVVQIPRDTYLETADVSTVLRVNSYYSVYYNRAKKNGADDPQMTALKGLAGMIETNFGVRLNYCALVDLEGFINIIDAIGGVYIDIPHDMFYEDPYQDLYIDLKAGYQRLDGQHAMQYVRFRKGYVEQDIGRQNALKNLMSALLAQLKQNLNVTTVAKLATEVMGHLKTNIDAQDFVYFAKAALSVDLENVRMITLPGAPTTVKGASVYVLYRDDTIDVINKYLNVFPKDLTREDFDQNSVMYDPDSERLTMIYETPSGSSERPEYNAGDLSENPIDVPRK